jgi:hypothetical protein
MPRRCSDNIGLDATNKKNRTDALTLLNGTVVQNPKNFLTFGKTDSQWEMEFGSRIPNTAEHPAFFHIFQNWLSSFASYTLHQYADTVSSTDLTIQNNLMVMHMEVPSSSFPSNLTSMSLETIMVRPSQRGLGVGKAICEIILRVWVVQHKFTLEIPKAIDTTSFIFNKLVLKDEFKHSVTFAHSEPIRALGLAIQHAPGFFTSIRITPANNSPDRASHALVKPERDRQ